MLIAFVAAFLASVAATFVVRGWARGRGFVDRPGGHKGHARPIALGGGIAITACICLPLVAVTLLAHFAARSGGFDWLPQIFTTHQEGIAAKLPEVMAIVAGALVLHILGLVDDVKALGFLPKLVVQFGVAVVVVWVFGIRAGEALGATASITLTVLWIVLITNAFNFLDNMDGLSAGVAAITGAIFAASALRSGQVFVPALAFIFVGTLVGFLVFNTWPASIFMGDAGSMVVGYFMAVLTVLTTYYNPEQDLQPTGVLVPLAVLAVPLYDVVSVCWHRIRAGDSPFRGDHRHFSHRLAQKGMSPPAAVRTIYLATAATGLSAILLPQADRIGAVIAFAQCLCIVLIIAVLEHAGRVK
ncbi:MAG: undecaprenyl/decaprenyl-phosphate alpha-N-acetylglucosaminyl 1-phosphate transferase [Phycisphaerae bacterium]|nr:undecaprenyl/decaprenyl-phosphate alpha-N-acetylglucosaminyl 1-phosphate transferase [Phycisphaerae bacterium]